MVRSADSRRAKRGAAGLAYLACLADLAYRIKRTAARCVRDQEVDRGAEQKAVRQGKANELVCRNTSRAVCVVGVKYRLVNQDS